MRDWKNWFISMIVVVIAFAALCEVVPAADESRAAKAADIPLNQDSTLVEGRPLTAVVVTQCNQLVVVYLTMADGRLLRFDRTSGVTAVNLLVMADTAARRERVEVACSEVST